MTKYKLIKFIFLLTFILVSCNDKQIIKKADSEPTPLSSRDSALTRKEKEYLEKQKESSNRVINYDNNLKPEQLSKFLPGIINGFETLPVSTGTMDDENNKLITYVKAQFETKHSSVIIDIMDYGKNAVIPNIANYNNPPQDLDADVEKIVIESAKGFLLWDVKNKFGRLEVLLQNRFIVIVRYNNPGNDKNILKKIYKFIKINELVKS
jgi:hypothetical protein